jgi:hypothetical protein
MRRSLVDNESTSSLQIICCIGANIFIVSILKTLVTYSLFPEVMPFLDLSCLLFGVKPTRRQELLNSFKRIAALAA